MGPEGPEGPPGQPAPYASEPAEPALDFRLSDSELSALLAADPLSFQRFNPSQRRFFDAVADPVREGLTIVLFLKGNRAGGSWGLGAVRSAVMFGSDNPLFSRAPYGPSRGGPDRWPFRRAARLAAPIGSLGDRGPLRSAQAQLYPVGRCVESRGAGKPYYSEGSTYRENPDDPDGPPLEDWVFDAVTYDQAGLQVAGSTLGVVFLSEPPPAGLFSELLTRLSGNGMMIAEFTQLDLAAFVEEYVQDAVPAPAPASARSAQEAAGYSEDAYATPEVGSRGYEVGQLMLDGVARGEVRIVRGDIHESCRECHEGGHQSHSAVMATIAGWSSEERQARRSGEALHLSGRILPAWGPANWLAELPEYHRECWSRSQVLISTSMDPHDRKPWAVAWAATFPNEDTVWFAEWPPFDFDAAKSSPLADAEDYRSMILETESAIERKLPPEYRSVMSWALEPGRVIRRFGRVGDPRFLEAPKAGSEAAADSVRKMLARACRACREAAAGSTARGVAPTPATAEEARAACAHKLVYRPAPDSNRIDHGPLRARIGGPQPPGPDGRVVVLRPKEYAMRSACPNLVRGLLRYAYHEERNPEKGLGERVQYKSKDFADVVRYHGAAKLHVWPAERQDVPRDSRPERGPGTANPG